LHFATTKLIIKRKEMENSTKQLLETYYKGFAAKANWESVIADDFQYVGGDMTKTEPLFGKQAYIEVLKRFFQVFTAMRVKEMIIQDDMACVIGKL
jgi:hypothetical protein